MYKILDNLATHGIAYDNDRYPISKDSISEQEILTSSEKIDGMEISGLLLTLEF
jgi:hypothetical protein